MMKESLKESLKKGLKKLPSAGYQYLPAMLFLAGLTVSCKSQIEAQGNFSSKPDSASEVKQPPKEISDPGPASPQAASAIQASTVFSSSKK